MVTATRAIGAARPPAEEAGSGAPREVQRLAHLLRRAGFGATPEELREALARGYEDTLEDLLNPQRVEESPALAEDLLYRYFPDTAAESRAAMPFLAYRMVNTRRPLQEKMALFWHNLFATACSKVRVCDDGRPSTRCSGATAWATSTAAAGALAGPGDDLLAGQPGEHQQTHNENYGRELLELFSMGIGNYTEDDVKDRARAFTGWTVKNATPPSPSATSRPSSTTGMTCTTTGRRPSWARPGP